MRILISLLCCLLASCVIVIHDPPKSNSPDASIAQTSQELKELHPCKSIRFEADSVPEGYQFDLNCPPEIFDPPNFIPPHSPIPVETR